MKGYPRRFTKLPKFDDVFKSPSVKPLIPTHRSSPLGKGTSGASNQFNSLPQLSIALVPTLDKSIFQEDGRKSDGEEKDRQSPYFTCTPLAQEVRTMTAKNAKNTTLPYTSGRKMVRSARVYVPHLLYLKDSTSLRSVRQ